MVERLFVGGPLDGERIELAPHVTQYRYLEPIRLVTPYAGPIQPPAKAYTYEVRHFYAKNGRLDVMALVGVTDEAVIRQLIEHYRG